MQTIWTRAASTGASCNGGSFSLAGTVARRTTTAASRRRVKFGDAVTVFYSTVLASAALMDMEYKSVRKSKLDEDLEKAKNDLKIISDRLEDAKQRRIDRLKAGISRLPAPSTYRVLQEPALAINIGLDDLEGETDSVPRSRTRYLDEQQLVTIQTSTARMIKRLQMHKDHRRHLEARCEELSRQLRLSVQTPEVMDDELRCEQRSLQLDQSAHVFGWTEDYDWCPEELKQRLDMAKAELFDHDNRTTNVCNIEKGRTLVQPDYSVRGGLQAREVGQDLNKKIMTLLKHSQERGDRIFDLIPKICGKLLSTTTPPDLKTYNLLLDHLARRKQKALVRIVMDSLFESGLQPDKYTISHLLVLYSITKDEEGFKSLARMMSIPGGNSNREHRRQLQLGSNCIAHAAEKSIVVYGGLINGSIIFRRVRRARVWLRTMTRCGVPPNIPILTSLLRMCCDVKSSDMQGEARKYWWLMRQADAAAQPILCEAREIAEQLRNILEYLPPGIAYRLGQTMLKAQEKAIAWLQQYVLDRTAVEQALKVCRAYETVLPGLATEENIERGILLPRDLKLIPKTDHDELEAIRAKPNRCLECGASVCSQKHTFRNNIN
jgi:hypothetical protein